MSDKAHAFVPHNPGPIAGSETGPLAGLTFAIKDLYDTRGHVTGGGSPDWLRTHEPALETSGAVQSLLDAGATSAGKTICDEFFYSFTGANAHYGTPLNSRAPDRMPGGSSSGSASAAAAGLCDFGLGSDTNGSIRVPASFCGLYGLRPSHGRVDLSNAMAMAPSFDTGGWMARDVSIFRDVGPVLLDDNSVASPINNLVLAGFAFDHCDEEVSSPLKDFLQLANKDLPNITPLDNIPTDLDLDGAFESFRIIQAYETWQSFGEWIEANKPNLGPGIKERMAIAKTITADQKAQADADHKRLGVLLNELIPVGQVWCMPSAASLSPLLNATADSLDHFRVHTMSLLCLSGLAGLPQLTIPACDVNGVPVGLSFMGWRGGDEALLDLAGQLSGYCSG